MLQVILKRLKLNFLTARFWIGCAILLVLAVLSLLMGVREYEERTELYEAGRREDASRVRSPSILTYSQTETVLHRPVEPLGALSQGLGERFGSVAYLRGTYGSPVISSRSRSNFLLPSSMTTDFTLFTHLFLALIAIFLTSDVISGERQFGTLQLTLSNPLPRWRLLLGEYFGALISLGLPTALILTLAVALMAATGIYDGSLDMTLKLALLGILYLLNVSVFILLGLWISSSSEQSTTALATGFLVWVLLVAIYPNAGSWIATQIAPLDRVPVVVAENTVTRSVGQSAPGETLSPELLERYRNQNFARARLIDHLWTLTPFSNSLMASRTIAGTGLEAHRAFLSQVRRLDQSLKDWQREKVLQYPERERRFVAGQSSLDLSGLPEGSLRVQLWHQVAEEVAIQLFVLLLWNLVAFLMLQLTFFRYDIRAG